MGTYAKFDQSHTDDPRWIEAGPDAFALHVAAVVWSDRMLTDGIITDAMAARVSLAVPPDRTTAAVAALIAHRFWVRTESGELQIVDFPTHAFPAEQVKRTRARWAADKQRRRQHSLGDHSLCKDPKYCPAIREDSTVDVHVDSTRIDQTRPDQTRPEGRGGSGTGMGAVGSASGDRAHASGAHGSSATPPSGPPPGVVPTLNGVPVTQITIEDADQ